MANKSYLNQAFSLVELLVTIVILSVLVSVAAPMYSKYMLQSKVSAMYESATPAKFIVTNDYYSKGNCSTANYTYSSGNPQFLKPTNYVSSMSIATGVITVTGNSTKLNSNAIILTIKPSIDAQQQVNWTCCVNNDSFLTYAPTECKNSASVCTAIPSC
jgi:prepilin-type N-terminal cleavage/methylation domain-containing protein